MHAQGLIRTFALHSYILKYPIILLVDGEGPDPSVSAYPNPKGTFLLDVAHVIAPNKMSNLTHCRLNELPHTMYWKSPISILGR